MNQNAGGTSTVNAFKMLIERQTVQPPAVRPFVPLKVKAHPQQGRIDAYNAIKSRYA